VRPEACQRIVRTHHYNYFRDYDPGIGRYVQSDPIGLRGGINSYAFVANAPLDEADAFGLSPHGYGCRLSAGGEQLPSHLGCCSVKYVCRSFVSFEGGFIAGGHSMWVLSCGSERREIGYDPKNDTTYVSAGGGGGATRFYGLSDYRCPLPSCAK
jgi:hypothetical protein